MKLPLFEKLKKSFGGFLTHRKKEHAIRWTVVSKKDLRYVLNLMNGFLRSPKKHQFNKLIDYVNSFSKDSILLKYEVDRSNLLNNYWLAGFIDADGGFKIRYTLKGTNSITGHKTKERIALSFKIEQAQIHKDTGLSFKPIMDCIAISFGTKVYITKHNKGKKYLCVELFSITHLRVLIRYLDLFPLLSAKRNDLNDFKLAFELFENKKVYSVSGKAIVYDLKQGMNRKRLIFDWQHLS